MWKAVQVEITIEEFNINLINIFAFFRKIINHKKIKKY